MFTFLSTLLDYRPSFDLVKSYKKKKAQAERNRQFVDNFEVRLARLCMTGKMNGFTEYQMAIQMLPKLKTSFEDSQENSKHFYWWKLSLTSGKNVLLSALFLAIFLISIFGSIFILCTPCQRFGMMLGRKAMFKLEPYWDWQEVYYSRCLLPKNSFWSAKRTSPSTSVTTKSDCDYCEDITEMNRLNLSQFSGHKARTGAQFVFNIANKIPFIYDDPTLLEEIKTDWPLFHYSTVHHWMEFFKEEIEQPLRICMFKCSLVSAAHPSQLFSQLYSFCPPTWYAHWENCGTRTMKKVRKLIRRPSFLPAMVELSKPSWILLSGSTPHQQSSSCDERAKSTNKSYKEIKPLTGTDLLIVVQVHGQVQLKLTPTRSECTDDACHSLDAVSLTAGQMAVVNVKYWSLSYRSVTASRTEEGECINTDDEGTFNLSIILAGIHV